jgi:hypothetical protein
VKTSKKTPPRGTAEEITLWYNKKIHNACSQFGRRITSKCQLPYSWLRATISEYERQRDAELAALKPVTAAAPVSDVPTATAPSAAIAAVSEKPTADAPVTADAPPSEEPLADVSFAPAASTPPASTPPASSAVSADATTSNVPPKKRRVRRWHRKPTDWVEPVNPTKKIGRPTNAERAARFAAQAAPAELPFDAWLPSPTAAKLLVPKELPGSKPGGVKLLVPATPSASSAERSASTSPAPRFLVSRLEMPGSQPASRPAAQPSPAKSPSSAVTMALPRFDRAVVVVAARDKGDELVKVYQEKAASVAQICMEEVPAASAGRAAWVAAATGVHNARVRKLNELEAEVLLEVTNWQAGNTSELIELKEGLLRLDATRESEHVIQVMARLKFVQAQSATIQARLNRLHSRWLESVRAALTKDVAAIDKRLPPGSEPDKRRGGTRKYDQATGKSVEETDDTDSD